MTSHSALVLHPKVESFECENNDGPCLSNIGFRSFRTKVADEMLGTAELEKYSVEVPHINSGEIFLKLAN